MIGITDVRDTMNAAQAKFPAGADKYTVTEINFSAFPILVIALSGDIPERALLRAAKDLQSRVAGLDSVLKADLSGARDEILEVVIDPLRLEAYNVTAAELITVVTRNNQPIATGEVETASGAFAVKLPASFYQPRRCLRPAGQGEWRPSDHPWRSGRHSPDVSGCHRPR